MIATSMCEVDDACISAGIASVPLNDAAVSVSVVLDVPPCAGGLEVLVPRPCVFSKVGFTATVGCREDERLSREDTIKDAMAGGDGRLKELD